MFTRATGRWYFAAQTLAGVAWWVSVFTVPWVREATLGDLNPALVAAFDLPLFVGASALAAFGARWAIWIVTPWTALVTAGMALYATITGLAGWGAAAMIAATVGSVGAAFLVWCKRMPTERLLVGPFAFREASAAEPRGHVARTARQIVVFWGLFLVVIPTCIALLEARWGLRLDWTAGALVGIRVIGAVLLTAASVLGIWSAFAMSTRGDGTPLPSATARRLVIAGPYRWVRNPMALAGIAQGVAVGLLLGSWFVVIYALAGSFFWNWVIRPHEEADLRARFGEQFERYADRVACWVPRRPTADASRALS